MPIYEYRCSNCGYEKEYLQKLNDPPHSVCPDCDQETYQKIISQVAFQLKGSGWYATDFKDSGKKTDTTKKESQATAASTKDTSTPTAKE